MGLNYIYICELNCTIIFSINTFYEHFAQPAYMYTYSSGILSYCFYRKSHPQGYVILLLNEKRKSGVSLGRLVEFTKIRM